ncbi:MAG: hypothetical protein KY454_01820 [Actinobacteria bacterium]|nr:hypothetical protein [Actinomycetota bacterium]
MGGGVADRRAETHLWLLLEETLAAAVGAGGAGAGRIERARQARRNYGYVARALAASGLVAPAVADALVHELDDALALRGLADVSSFAGRPFPVDAAAAPATVTAGGPEVWLEAEIERHLELLAAMNPGERPGAGEEALRILSGPVRGLLAAGAGDACAALMAQLAASLAAAGFDIGPVATEPLAARPEWVRFLHDRPAANDGDQPVTEVGGPREPLGALGGRQVVLRRLAWSSTHIDVIVALGAPRAGQERELAAGLAVRALDDRGRLHLGLLPSVPFAGESVVHLRPGIDAPVASLQLRITAGGECVTAAIAL